MSIKVKGLTADELNYRLRTGTAKDSDAMAFMDIQNPLLMSGKWRVMRFIDDPDPRVINNYLQLQYFEIY